jgi:hypothetical protein
MGPPEADFDFVTDGWIIMKCGANPAKLDQGFKTNSKFFYRRGE